VSLLEELTNRAIPSRAQTHEAKQNYRSWPITREHPLYHEPLIEVRETGISGKNYYHLADNPPYNQQIPGSVDELFLRKTVLSKLQEINARIAPYNLELFIHDGWRPAAVQHYLAEVWFPANVVPSNGEFQYWAPGPAHDTDIDPLSPPPHSTGGAVDLTLRTVESKLLWMGTDFDDTTPPAHTDAFEYKENLSIQDEEARANRRILFWLMQEAGFANNPTEWWHYSYGDQMWAKLTSNAEGKEIPAFYSNILPV
jgi:zinc D-Ala-D-Ala dipeptidase